jgi:hypothetical protein
MEPAAADLVPRIKYAAFLQALVRAGVPEGQHKRPPDNPLSPIGIKVVWTPRITE